MAEITYFSKIMHHHVQFDNGEDPATHKPRPPVVAEFINHMLRTSDPEMQKRIESHRDFGARFYRVDPGKALPVGGGTQYTHGPMTTASRPDIDAKPGEIQLTAGEKSALTRAKKKVEEGGELTETEAAVWEKYGDKE
jgi:hypothetical protein